MQLLDQFLSKVHKGMKQVVDLRAFISVWYPGHSDRSYLRLFSYMAGQGYLVRPQMGVYTLGPKGFERLGRLPAGRIEGAKGVSQESPPEPPVNPAPVVVPSAAVVAKVAPPVSVTGSPEVTAATAQAIAKARAAKAAADASEEVETQLRTRRDELLAQLASGPTPEIINAAVTSRLVQIAHDL